MNNQSTFAIACGKPTLFESMRKERHRDKRLHKRVPRSIGILVQPMDAEEQANSEEFFAITRDISQAGLSFLSSFESRFEFESIMIADQPGREVICRTCYSSIIVKNQNEDVYLTGVEFLYERYSR